MLLFMLGFIFTFCILAANAGDEGGEGNTQHTPDYYDAKVRADFKNGRWQEGKALLDEGLKYYPSVSGLNELAGSYYYHSRQYDDARYHLIKSVRDNNENVRAKQILVNVEDETGNYSSAICYVNELLEVNPYWKGLWRRKIELYRKQGNDVEADRLLKRICHIYPEDSQLRNDYADRLYSDYRSQRQSGNKDEAVESLRELVQVAPKNEEYYLALSNLLLQQGRTEEAKEVAGRGAEEIPYSVALIKKKAGILAEESRYPEALAFVKMSMSRNHSGALSSFYNSLLADAARAESQRDPYVLYGKVYDTQHSSESLDYLLNTSFSRGYDEDALYYINEARKRSGDTPALLYKAYVVNKRVGNVREANTLLKRIYDLNPTDEDVADKLARIRIEQANELMTDGFYGEALPLLELALTYSRTDETDESARRKMLACNYELKRYAAAEAVLDTLEARYPDASTYVTKKADLLAKRGKITESLNVLQTAYSKTAEPTERFAISSAYEEISLPYIKQLMAAGALPKAADQCESLLKMSPSSSEGLHFAINAAAGLNRWSDYDQYVARGVSLYPDDHLFTVRQAAGYNRTKQFQRAVELVRPYIDEFPGDSLLLRAFTDNSCDYAEALIGRHRADSALSVLDSALVFAPGNRQLLYTKGLAYEQMHQWDSAYVYLKYYRPDYDEVRGFKRHLADVRTRGDRNILSAEYLQGRYGEDDIITSVATLSYTRKLKHDNAITGRVNYAGRDGGTSGNLPDDQVPGGTGVQLQAEYAHTFSDKWSGTLSGAWSNKYFPQFSAFLSATRTFNNGWEGEIHGSYRRINTYSKEFAWSPDTLASDDENAGGWVFDNWKRSRKNLFGLGLGVTKEIGDFRLGGKLDGYAMSSHFYVNASLQGKYFPLSDRRSNITMLAGVGTAPEATLIEQAMPASFERLNTMVGLGGDYFICKGVSVGLLGTWYTFYHQTNTRTGTFDSYTDGLVTRYKNLFNIDVHLDISF